MSSLNVLYSIRVHAKETVRTGNVGAELQVNTPQATLVHAAFHAQTKILEDSREQNK